MRAWRGLRVGPAACALLSVIAVVACSSCSQDPVDELAALQDEFKMAPTDFIASVWVDHIPELQPGTAYLQDMIRSVAGARGLDAVARECAVKALESNLETGKTLGDFTIGIVGSSAVKKGKLSPTMQPCASPSVWAQEQAGTPVVAADLDLALPRRVLLDGVNQAATDIGMDDVERACAVGKSYGALSDAELLSHFTSGDTDTGTDTKAAVKACVTGDRVLPVAKRAKQQARTDEVNRERFRQLSEAAINRALSQIPQTAPSTPAPSTTGP